MAKSLNLRQYQEEIIARLETVSKSDAVEYGSRLGVVVGGQLVLVSLAEITEAVPLVELHQVPLAKSWFLGMSNVRGNLYAINHLAQLTGLAMTAPTSDTRILLLNEHVISNVGLMVDKLVGLRNIQNMKQISANENVAECFRKQAYEDVDANVWLELSCDLLVKSREFTQPSLVVH